MNPTRSLRLLATLGLTGILLILAGGCATSPRDSGRVVSRGPITYAIVLFLADDQPINAEERAYAMTFARDTLLASGVVGVEDRMIDDPERAEMLFRARMEDGQLVEIAGVPAVTTAQTVVLSRPHYVQDRIWWDASYPLGYPTYAHARSDFPVPGPGWGRPYPGGRYPDRGDRPDRDDRPDRPNRPERPDRDDRPDRPKPNRPERPNRPDFNPDLQPGPVERPAPRPERPQPQPPRERPPRNEPPRVERPRPQPPAIVAPTPRPQRPVPMKPSTPAPGRPTFTPPANPRRDPPPAPPPQRDRGVPDPEKRRDEKQN